jgi:TPR repeat protein
MSFELEAHADDHGRVYQQGLGQQFNVERAYIGSKEMLVSRLLPMIVSPLVRESDPLEIGVHRSAISQGNAVPPYVPRDTDRELAEKVELAADRGGLILIVGDSTAGKSRSAYEVMLHAVPNRRLVIPDDRPGLNAALIQMVASPDESVLWLDNMERFLGSDGLTARAVSYLKSQGVLSIGTMRTEEYRKFRESTIAGPSRDSRAHNELIAAEHVLEQADLVIMQRRWSADEEGRAQNFHDPRIAEALNHSKIYGVAEYLAAGPMLHDEWQLAWSAGGNPRGAALVAAAVDCYRAGFPYSVPLDLLREIHEHYLDLRGGALLRPESFESAVAWATQRRYGITSLLLPGKKDHTYRAFDYLIDKVMESVPELRVPEEVWTALIKWSKENNSQLRRIAAAAFSQQRDDIAERIWRNLASDGVGVGAYNIAMLRARKGDFTQAEEWYAKAYDLGYLKAATQLGHLFEYERNQIDSAEPWYMRAAEKGDPHGMYHIAVILSNKGQDEEAEDWFRRAIDSKERIASNGLGELLVKSGRVDEAESILRAAMEEGDKAAGNYLAIVFADLGRTDEAEQVWLKLAESNMIDAEANLARLYRRTDRDELAEKWYLRAIEHGMERARSLYGSFLAERRRWAEAETVLRPVAESGDLDACADLGAVLIGGFHYSDAVPWLQKAVDGGIDRALPNLATALEQSGRPSEAIPYWQRLADQNDTEANYALGKIRLALDDPTAAAPLFQSAAEDGHSLAACELARIYWKENEDYAQAEKWLKASLDLGHDHAACLLGSLYVERGMPEDAEKYWRTAYEMGHFDAPSRLSRLLVSQGRGREASLWLRRANEEARPGRQRRKGAPRKRKPRRRR